MIVKSKPLVLLLAFAMVVAACKKPSSRSTDIREPVEAEAFHGEVYRSLDGRTALTLISRDECELRDSGRTILCKYTRQADALRVVATVLGTNEVVYYRLVEQGIQDNSGSVLFSPARYTAALEQARVLRNGGTSFLIRLLQEDVEVTGLDGKVRLEKRTITKSMLDQTVEVIRKRLNAFGTNPPVITTQGADRILVQIPGFDTSKLQDVREHLQKVAAPQNPLAIPIKIEEERNVPANIGAGRK